MPTNEERREVARNIRNADLTKHASYYEEVKGWDHVRATRFVLVSNLGSAIGIDKAIFSIDDLKIRLADLIEPEPERTCHNLSEFQDCDCFTCSNCGESYEMRRLKYDIDEYCTLDDAIKALDYDGCYCDVRYCPNCGSKVIEE